MGLARRGGVEGGLRVLGGAVDRRRGFWVRELLVHSGGAIQAITIAACSNRVFVLWLGAQVI